MLLKKKPNCRQVPVITHPVMNDIMHILLQYTWQCLWKKHKLYRAAEVIIDKKTNKQKNQKQPYECNKHGKTFSTQSLLPQEESPLKV